MLDQPPVVTDQRVGNAQQFSDLQLRWPLRVVVAVPQRRQQPAVAALVVVDRMAQGREELFGKIGGAPVLFAAQQRRLGRLAGVGGFAAEGAARVADAQLLVERSGGVI